MSLSKPRPQRSTIWQLYTNRALKELWNPLKLQQHSWIKPLRITAQKGEEDSFIICVHHPIPKLALLSTKNKLPRASLPQNRLLGWATSFPTLSGHCMNVLHQFHPTPAGKVNSFRDGRERRGEAGAARSNHTAGVIIAPSDLICRQTDSFPHGKPRASRAASDPLQISWLLTHRYSHVHWCQLPESFSIHTPQPRPPLGPRICIGSHPRPVRPLKFKTSA